jgi:hypothetical protein
VAEWPGGADYRSLTFFLRFHNLCLESVNIEVIRIDVL